jgi:hypothetical protein
MNIMPVGDLVWMASMMKLMSSVSWAPAVSLVRFVDLGFWTFGALGLAAAFALGAACVLVVFDVLCVIFLDVGHFLVLGISILLVGYGKYKGKCGYLDFGDL